MASNSLPKVDAEFVDKFLKPSLPGLPKYGQLREMLVAAIIAGYWGPGDQLPAETDLARLTGFSLGTAQRALRALVEEGLVVRIQGNGTFVTNGLGLIEEPLHLRFLGEAGEPRFLPLIPTVLTRKRISKRGPWSDWLSNAGVDLLRIDRKLSVNGEFNVFSSFYFDAHTFRELAEQPLKSLEGISLKELLGSVLSMPITSFQQSTLLVPCAPHICKVIGISPNAYALLLQCSASAGRAKPVYYLESFIPPTNRRLCLSNDY